MKRVFVIFAALLLTVGMWACDDKEDGFTSGFRVNNGVNFLSLDGLSRSGIITVEAKGPWQITTDPTQEWYSLSVQSGGAGRTDVEVSFEQNDGVARAAVLQFKTRDNLFDFTLSQSAQGVGFDATDYNFYITFGTLPTLYAGLYLLADPTPSYVFYSRTRTFDASRLPAHAEVFEVKNPDADATPNDTQRMRDEVKRRILKINSENPTAVFGFYVDDLRCRLGYDWFVAQGIDSTRVKVTMLSDGTATYSLFNDYFGDNAPAQQNWEEYAAQVEALDWNHDGRYPQTRSLPEFESYTWPYYLSTRPNYRLVMQDRLLLETSDAFVIEKTKQMRAENVQPYDLLAALPGATQRQFYDMAKFDCDTFAAMFNASDKPNLIVIGTNPGNDVGAQQQQVAYVEQVMTLYGEAHDIFFKPHPADPSSAGYESRFPGLKLLPGQMPFEIFVWSLLDEIDIIGGYPSTTFLTVPLSKVRFIFAPSAEGLLRPLNQLFRDAKDIQWIS